MVRTALLLVVATAFAGCQTNLASSGRTAESQKLGFSGGDGSSVEKAVVITGSGVLGDVKAEHIWLDKHAPGAHTLRQALLREGMRSFDQLTVTLPDGSERSYFFDITSGMSALENVLGT